MMNRKSGGAPVSAAMRSAANQLELAAFGSQRPGLVGRELAHICGRLAPASFELKVFEL